MDPSALQSAILGDHNPHAKPQDAVDAEILRSEIERLEAENAKLRQLVEQLQQTLNEAGFGEDW